MAAAELAGGNVRGRITVVVLSSLLALHNAQRLAPVSLFDELRLRLAVDYVGVGNLFAAYLVTYALFSIPAGMLADRIDNKLLVATGAALSLLASALFALATRPPIAMAARLGLGLAGSLLYVPAVRYVVATFPQERRASIMGVLEIGAGGGQIFSLTLLPFLAGRIDLAGSFLILPLLAALVLGGILFGLSPARPQTSPRVGSHLRVLAGDTRLLRLIAFHFLGMLAAYAIFGWLPTFVRAEFGYSAVQAGMVGALVNGALCIFSPVAGVLSDRLGSRVPVLLAGSALSLLCFALLLVSRDPVVLLGTAFLTGASLAMTIPVFMIFVGESFAASGAGLAVSMAGTVGQISSAISGPLFGYILEATRSFATVWGVAMFLAGARIPFLLSAGGVGQRAKDGASSDTAD